MYEAHGDVATMQKDQTIVQGVMYRCLLGIKAVMCRLLQVCFSLGWHGPHVLCSREIIALS